MGEPLGQWTRTSAGGSGMRRTSRLIPKTWKGIGFMEVIVSQARKRALVRGLLDSLELGLDAVQRGARLVVLVPGVRQVTADHVEGFPELLEVAPQPREALLDLLDAPLEVLEGELGVHRHHAVADAHDGVHAIARRELVLELEVPQQHLRQEVFEEGLPEASADLGRLEDLLEAGDALAHLEDAL